MTHSLEQKEKALLISTYRLSTEKSVCLEHLDELELLVDTYGICTYKKEAVPLRRIDPSTFLGSGKIEELARENNHFEVVIIDEDITPAQQRNLETMFKKTVLDRTEVILGVFADRAQTKEAKLQIELAKVRYELPRLKRLWTHLHRQRGSGGSAAGAYLKGEGEKQIEIDKRLLREKGHKLQKEIEEVKKDRWTQRQRRHKLNIPTFALIGYTNVGKSTLLNALTEAKVFVEDKLFATLDTTTRKFTLPNSQDILLIDTVGFIRKLPHLLIAAFKSTLEESVDADILLHLIDANNPLAIEHAETTYSVLEELNKKNKPIISVFNKCDLCQDRAMIQRLKIAYPKNVEISAFKQEGFEELFTRMIDEIKNLREEVTMRIPQSEYHIVTELIQEGNVLRQEYEENDVILTLELSRVLAGKYRAYSYEKI